VSDPRLLTLTEKLKRRGYRLTPQRLAVLKILANSEEHPTVEQIHARVHAEFPTTSLATVYKTIAMLKSEGEVLELGFGNISRYDGFKPRPHPHLICTQCQSIVDPDEHMFADLSKELAQKYGYQITNYRVDYFGICPECQRQNV